MTPTAATPVAPGAYAAEFEERAGAAAAAGEPESLRALRRTAIERFGVLGFPTLAQEAWKYTNVEPIARRRFARPPAAAPTAAVRAGVERQLFTGCDALVFVDGRFAPALSRLPALPARAVAATLAESLAPGGAGRPELEEHLGRHSSFREQPFAALNTALFTDGAFILVPRGAVFERPLQVLFYATGETSEGLPPVTYPRTLIVAGENSQATILETYAGPDGPIYWTCPVTEIVAGESAVVDHYKLQREGLGAYHTAVQHTRLERAASLSSHSISVGGALVRHDVDGALVGEGGDANLNGLYMARGEQHVDTHMTVAHQAAHCDSHELYKGVLDGKARAIFNGLIHVHRGAQKTDAKQTNRNLLLSREALVNTNPQLLIFADDVKCTHGSTVGQLDADAVFYLRSRGIGQQAAKSLLTYAFAHDIVERIKFEPLKQDLEAFLFAWLPGGEVVAQAV